MNNKFFLQPLVINLFQLRFTKYWFEQETNIISKGQPKMIEKN